MKIELDVPEYSRLRGVRREWKDDYDDSSSLESGSCEMVIDKIQGVIEEDVAA
jgi:hypothetical protein